MMNADSYVFHFGLQHCAHTSQTNEPTYDPQQYVRNANVIRTLNLAAPSERAAFRDKEIARLNRLQSKPNGY